MDSPHTRSADVRLAEVVGALCLATDLATGQQLEHGLRRALLAVWLGEKLGLRAAELSDTYYVSLLGTVGCTIESADLAAFFHDDIAFGRDIVLIDPTRPAKTAAYVLTNAGAGDPPLARARKVVSAALAGPSRSRVICRDVALQVGDLLDLGAGIGEAVAQCHEQWDGKGGPQRLRGETIHVAARIFRLTHDVEIFHRVGGIAAALDVVRERSGTLYDPEIAARFCDAAHSLFGRLETEAGWDAMLAAEPAPHRRLPAAGLEEILRAVANFVDVRSTYTLGHSAAVAALAEAGGRELGLAPEDVTTLRHAGLVHDVGRAGVPVALWDKRGRITADDRQRMRQHPALTELVLARSGALGHLGVLGGLHHERIDGSGYRSIAAASLPVAARVLAVADAYQAKLEPRPHRPAMTPDRAAEEVRRLADQGQLDADVVAATLAVAGHARAGAAPARPAGLSEREVEVLRLAVRGFSNREIAGRLSVSPKTVGHHIQHIYGKIGVSTRVGAALFAVHHGLADATSDDLPDA